MNKYFASLCIASSLLVSSNISAAKANPFEKLIPTIIESAATWVNESASVLSSELQLVHLNFFALSSQEPGEQLKKCIEFINANKEIVASYETLFTGIFTIVNKYREQIEKKFKNNVSEKEQRAITEKLDTKTQELFAIIIGIYYHMLYAHVTETTGHQPLYMFDENGIIPQNKRTEALPNVA